MVTKPSPMFLVILLTAIVASVVYFFMSRSELSSSKISTPPASPTQSKLSPDENAVRCTMEVRKCPDGSYVGRVAPNCSFASCPDGK